MHSRRTFLRGLIGITAASLAASLPDPSPIAPAVRRFWALDQAMIPNGVYIPGQTVAFPPGVSWDALPPVEVFGIERDMVGLPAMFVRDQQSLDAVVNQIKRDQLAGIILPCTYDQPIQWGMVDLELVDGQRQMAALLDTLPDTELLVRWHTDAEGMVIPVNASIILPNNKTVKGKISDLRAGQISGNFITELTGTFKPD